MLFTIFYTVFIMFVRYFYTILINIYRKKNMNKLLKLLLVCALILTTAFASCKAPDDSTDDSTSNLTSNSTNNSSTDQTDDSYVPSIEYPLDFEVRVEAGRDVKILQLTDPQVFENDDALLQKKCFSIMDYVVEQTKPDLILVTGDIIYGRYDETGEIFTKQVRVLRRSLGAHIRQPRQRVQKRNEVAVPNARRRAKLFVRQKKRIIRER